MTATDDATADSTRKSGSVRKAAHRREEAERVEGEARRHTASPPATRAPAACREAGRRARRTPDGLEHGGGAVGERREEGAEKSGRHAVIVATAAGRGLRVRGSAGTCS